MGTSHHSSSCCPWSIHLTRARIQVVPVEHNVFNEIPQLEEEDRENGQFADADTSLINRHNTHLESEQIQKEYTENLLDLTDNQYYLEGYHLVQLQYSFLDPDYYGLQPRRSHTKHEILWAITLHP